MKKLDLIKELVVAFVHSFKNIEAREYWYINHDSLESRINRSWKKEYVDLMYTYYINGQKSIREVMHMLDNSIAL